MKANTKPKPKKQPTDFAIFLEVSEKYNKWVAKKGLRKKSLQYFAKL